VIRPLRIAHRRVWPALALGLPALVLAALAARRPIPVEFDAIPFGAPAGRLVYAVEGRRADGVPFRASLYRATDGAAQALALSIPGEALDELPEVLAYWMLGDGADPIASGVLLGPVRGDELLRLPDQASRTPGVLVLYDLARGAVVATVGLTAPDVSGPGGAP